MITVFAPSIQEHLLLEKDAVQHIKEHHSGEMGDKSFFTGKPIKTILNGMKKSNEWYQTREQNRVLCVTHMDATIGYNPRLKKWCDTLLIVVELKRREKRIITAYPVLRITKFYGKLQIPSSLKEDEENK
jgi:hypothetical protein